MPRIVGKVELNLKADNCSVEDVRTLLQAIRDWEQNRQLDIFVGVNAPEMTNDETKYVFDNIRPPFAKQTFLPLKNKHS